MRIVLGILLALWASEAGAQLYCRDVSENKVPITSSNCDHIATTAGGGGGGGLSVTDGAAWTAASSQFTPGGGAFNDSAAALTSGQQGTQRLTPNRALHVSPRSQSGVELFTEANPGFVSGIGVLKNTTYATQTGSTIMGLVNTAVPTGGIDGNLDFVSLTTSRELRTTSQAIGALAATAPTQAISSGCNGVNAWPTPVTNGQMAANLCGLEGTQIVRLFSPKEVQVRGKATTTGNTATTVLAQSGSASLKTYVTDFECWNSSAVSITIDFTDVVGTGTNTTIFLPAGGGNNKSLGTPLVTAANTAFQFTPASSQTTIGCSAQGYYGP